MSSAPATVIGNATERTALQSVGARPIAPTAPVAFTATNPAVALSATATAYSAGFTVVNLGASTMWLTTVGAVAASGIPLAPGGLASVDACDASLWGAFAAAPCAGCIAGTEGQ